jgi:uncharacterized RDD family membrane protein YckC
VNHAAGGPDEHAPRGIAQPVAARVRSDPQAALRELRCQGLVTRGIAFAIDATLINVVAIVVAGGVVLVLSVLSVPDRLDAVLIAIGGTLFVAWTVAYFVVFWSTNGQTPGSRLMRIRVCRADDGSVIAPRRALLRLVCLTLAAIPLLLGFLPILFDPRRRGVHDMLAGTLVVEALELRRPDPGTWPP